MQIVGYDVGADSPEEAAALCLATGDGLERRPLAPGVDLAYALGERHCAGTIEDGRHVACDRPAAPYCPEHTDRWACARCVGDCDLPLPACREAHAVYLAAFAPDTFKVGVTRSWRLERRLREQGADRGARVRTVENGRIARRIEAGIARDLTDRVRVRTKIDGLHRAVDVDAWESLLGGFDVVEVFAFDYDLGLTGRPVVETLATGTVRGTKGRVAVLGNGATDYAVDLRDLVGHEVTPGGTGRDRQSSLGAFE